jgi:hypothetical protein
MLIQFLKIHICSVCVCVCVCVDSVRLCAYTVVVNLVVHPYPSQYEFWTQITHR